MTHPNSERPLESRVDTFEEYIREVRPFAEARYVFRGQRRVSWTLLPKIDREWYERHRVQQHLSRQQHELDILEDFIRRARPHLPIKPAGRGEWLALAQHHRLATRLLDWTRNPLVALYFAVEGSNRFGLREDAPRADQSAGANGHWRDEWTRCVWAYKPGAEEEDRAHHPGTDPLDFGSISLYEPPHVTDRIVAQDSVFTVHPVPEEHIRQAWLGRMVKIHIRTRLPNSTDDPMVALAAYRKALEGCGVTRATLFPGLEGIAVVINQRHSTPPRMGEPRRAAGE